MKTFAAGPLPLLYLIEMDPQNVEAHGNQSARSYL